MSSASSACKIHCKKKDQLTQINYILCTNNKYTETEIKNTILFTAVSKMIKYLGIHLTQYVQDQYIENYKILMEDIKEDINKLRDMLCLWIRRFNIVKNIPKLIYRFNAISIKILARFFRT